jgi:hypothetical protein
MMVLFNCITAFRTIPDHAASSIMRGALQLASTEPRQGAVGFAAILPGAFILALRCDLTFSVINGVAIVATPGSPDRKAPGLTAAELTAPCLGILEVVRAS